MRISSRLSNQEKLSLLETSGGFGLEKESLRVTMDGRLAQTPHPFSGDRHIDRDFCENQVEIITDPEGSVRRAVDAVRKYHEYAADTLWNLESGREMLWPFSNPPRISGEDEIPVAQFTGELADRTAYRNYLGRKYGKRKMLLSGIHFNYSYPAGFLRRTFEESGETDFRRFVDALYLKLARKATMYSWLIVALTAASPLYDLSLFEENQREKVRKRKLATVRSSEFGYWNDFTPTLRYESTEAYVASIQRYVTEGLLVSPKELYYPVRLKPAGEYSMEAFSGGISHIEIRSLDLNPLSSFGLMEEDVEFLWLLLCWMTIQPDYELSEERQKSAIHNMKKASALDLEHVILRNADGTRSTLTDKALEVLDRMERDLGGGAALDFQRNKILHRENRYSEIILERYGDDFMKSGIALASEDSRTPRIGRTAGFRDRGAESL
ncbi:MAG: hypothetical protein ACOYBD_03005 [Bilifractor sp.]|jgi:glutamate--cysteine ligase